MASAMYVALRVRVSRVSDSISNGSTGISKIRMSMRLIRDGTVKSKLAQIRESSETSSHHPTITWCIQIWVAKWLGK
ncbi:hypothetical protein EPI10_034216 [Gossypium australe]|uniref:Uncharacterized protein n=1 Tax=Gossypium australe TaxID=47621 RepID=A0A5B6TZB1_9ROSI|nr:hypothetical protein EPI10_034216 [Gossypium australe]